MKRARRSRILALALGLASAASSRASADEPTFDKQPPRTAFIFETRLGYAAGRSAVQDVAQSPFIVPAIGIRRANFLQITLGVLPITENVYDSDGGNVRTSTSVLLSAAADVVKSPDGRAAFFTRAGFAAGRMTIPGTGSEGDAKSVLGFDLALGGRYALKPWFALGGEVGLLQQFIEDSDPTTSRSLSGVPSGDQSETLVHFGLVATFFAGE
jgi:hypothetical protein